MSEERDVFADLLFGSDEYLSMQQLSILRE